MPAADGESYDLFDAAGRILARVDAMTGVAKLEYRYGPARTLTSINDTAGRATRIERDGSGRPTAIVSPDGERTALGLDANGFLSYVANPAGEAVTLRHASNGLLESLIDPRGTGYEHSFSYDAKGRLTNDQNPAGGFKTLARADTGNSYTVSVTTALGRVDTYRVDRLPTKDVRYTRTQADGTSEVRLVTPAGTRTFSRADGTTVTTSVAPDPRFGMQAPLSTVVTRTPGGNTMTVAKSRTAALSNPADFQSATSLGETLTVNGRSYSSTYDVATRTLTSTSAGGRTAVATRDAQGRVTEIRPPGYPALTPTFISYDAAGRPRAVTMGTRAISLTYDSRGFVESVTDPLNRVTSFGYDAAGRAQTQVLPGPRTVTFGYDAAGNMTSLVPPGRPAHTFAYSPMNRVTAYTPPNAVNTGLLATSYSHDLDGRLKRIVFPDQREITTNADSAGRLSTVVTSRGITSFGYDGAGRLSSVQAPGATVVYSYDGFLKTSETWSGAAAGLVSWSYDGDFRVASAMVTGGAAVAYSYDADSLLVGAGALSIVREPATGRVSTTMLGAVQTSSAYDAMGDLDLLEAGANGATVYSYTLYRDGSGRIVGKTEVMDGVTTTWSYDYNAEGRLSDVSANGQLLASYGYDSNGNRVQRRTPSATESGTVDDQDRLLTFGAATYSYTAAGALSARTLAGATTQYGYDELGNLLTVALPNGAAIEYLVDGLNRRVGKKVNGARVEGFLYEGQLRPVAWLDGSGAVKATFVYGTRVNVPEYMVTSSGTFRFVTDHLGSPRLVIDASTGAIVQRVDYDEWGRVLADTSPGFQPFGFAGGLYDRDTGLVRFGARDYDPAVGRWTNKDPIRFAGGDTNLYAYVGNDPVNFVDPWGLYIGQMPPLPPGYSWFTWKVIEFDIGWALQAPDGRLFLPHPEDAGHWRHWDIQKPGGGSGGRWPEDSLKPWPGQKKGFKKNQCTADPSGDAPGWEPPPRNPLYEGGAPDAPLTPFLPLPGPVPMPSPFPMPGPIPVPVW